MKHIANNQFFHERIKHIEMDCYFVRERTESKEVDPLYVNSKDRIVDLFTKAHVSRQLKLLLDKFDVCNLHAPS